MSFDLNNIVIQNVLSSINYLGVNLILCNNILTINVADRIGKLNMRAYNILLNTSYVSKVIRCELIVNKYLPVLLYRIDGISITNCDTYKLHIAHKKYADLFSRYRYAPECQTY